ncbi:MAG: YCF48-related protein [Patescibacteria group bacterium]
MKFLRFFSILLLLGIILSGCSLLNKNNDGGIYKSFDYGEHWEQKNFINNNDKKEISISGVNTREIVFDENDHSLVFLATRDSGLFVSTNAGEQWQRIFAGGFVGSVAPDPQKRGVIYLTSGNKLYKTIDMGANWRVVYLESRANVSIMQVAVDYRENKKLIISTSIGDILISNDTGESWNKVANLENDIVRKIIFNKNDPQIVYAGAINNGVFRSKDGGINWESLREKYEKNEIGSTKYRLMILDPSVEDGLFLVTDSGILNTKDGGETWEALDLVTSGNNVYINTFAVNQKNINNMYYTVNNILYRTFDGGKNWLSSKVPTEMNPIFLIVDPETSNVLYMGLLRKEDTPFFFVQYE